MSKALGQALQPQLKPGQRLVSREGDVWRWDGFTAAADGTLKAVFNYMPDPGENGNFYFLLHDGTVAWLNLGNPDLNCIGCTVDAGQITFN